jgi:hypothetical protein
MINSGTNNYAGYLGMVGDIMNAESAGSQEEINAQLQIRNIAEIPIAYGSADPTDITVSSDTEPSNFKSPVHLLMCNSIHNALIYVPQGKLCI